MDQTPSDVLEEQNSSRVNLSCEHQIPSYDTILWYRRSQGSNRLDLIAYVSYKQPTVEANFTGYFSVDGDGEKWSRLELLKPRSPEDTGEYYCAARMHCDEEPTYAATKTLELPQERENPPILSADVLSEPGEGRRDFDQSCSVFLHREMVTVCSTPTLMIGPLLLTNQTFHKTR